MENRIKALEITVSQMADILEQHYDVLSRDTTPLDGYIKLTCESNYSPIYVKSSLISGLIRIEDDTLPYTEVMITGGDIYRVSETPETILESLGYQNNTEK